MRFFASLKNKIKPAEAILENTSPLEEMLEEQSESVERHKGHWHTVPEHPTEVAQARMILPSKSLNMLEKGTSDLCDFAQKQWVTLLKPFVVDSGAGETVLPADELQSHPTKESAGSWSGEYYITADGSKLYNEGQKEVVISSMDGAPCRRMTFQVAQVHKALGPVSQRVRDGNGLVFDMDAYRRDISHIVNTTTNDTLYTKQESGVYVLDVLVAPPEYLNQSNGTPTFIGRAVRAPGGALHDTRKTEWWQSSEASGNVGVTRTGRTMRRRRTVIGLIGTVRRGPTGDGRRQDGRGGRRRFSRGAMA